MSLLATAPQQVIVENLPQSADPWLVLLVTATVTLAGVGITAWITTCVAKKNRVAENRRHLAALRFQQQKHDDELKAIHASARREREAAVIAEAVDFFYDLGRNSKAEQRGGIQPAAERLAARFLIDFPEDDNEFAQAAHTTLRRVGSIHAGSSRADVLYDKTEVDKFLRFLGTYFWHRFLACYTESTRDEAIKDVVHFADTGEFGNTMAPPHD